MSLSTPITELFGIQHPVVLAGMFVASGPRLAAAVSNAGGLGVIGGLTLTPKQLRTQIADLKSQLVDKSSPFGVDLAIPKIGDGARKTNYDYTHGHLSELIDIIIAEKAKVFVCAIGVCPPEIVKRLHNGGVYVANMIGSPAHIPKVLAAGVDVVCAQGGEGGGHTGSTPFSVLIPAIADACKGKLTPSGRPVCILAAGGVFDGRGLAAALVYGAHGVWVGTRFVASVEAAAPEAHKKQIVSAGFGDTTTTLIYSGRPLRVRKTPYVAEWNDTRADEIKALTDKGIIPHAAELEKNPKRSMEGHPFLMGDDASMIKEVLPAKVIVESMVTDAVRALKTGSYEIRARI